MLFCGFISSWSAVFFSGMFLPSRARSTKYIYILLNSDVCLPCSVLAILLMILKVIQNKGCKEIINIKMCSFCFHDSDFTVLGGVDWKSEQRAAWSTTDPARVVGDRCGAKQYMQHLQQGHILDTRFKNRYIKQARNYTKKHIGSNQ